MKEIQNLIDQLNEIPFNTICKAHKKSVNNYLHEKNEESFDDLDKWSVILFMKLMIKKEGKKAAKQYLSAGQNLQPLLNIFTNKTS